ncbi:hypothetical protein DFP72DRAFT_1106084 [Ephemerocybe angulata]|uniref:Uncharacterized protein n=1 Tax=Ephemerocybe angulata TaxID=980116 RepID=A0A8H6H897_9AGAR|nr:hypothetical protein DFP72DRAFT_1106084 [Tulosesus angulatus]
MPSMLEEDEEAVDLDVGMYAGSGRRSYAAKRASNRGSGSVSKSKPTTTTSSRRAQFPSLASPTSPSFPDSAAIRVEQGLGFFDAEDMLPPATAPKKLPRWERAASGAGGSDAGWSGLGESQRSKGIPLTGVRCAKWATGESEQNAVAFLGTKGDGKSKSAIPVLLLSDAGSGFASDVIAGMEFAITTEQTSGDPSVVSMSLGEAVNSAIDTAAKNLVASSAQSHTAVASGNANTPARIRKVITVAATTITGEWASLSKFGSLIDLRSWPEHH